MTMNKIGISAAAGVCSLLLPGMPCAGTVSYQYDKLSRLVQVAYADGRSIAYAYDPAGNRIGTTLTGDADGDGLADAIDSDDDNDGVPDAQDAFPLDPGESLDTDHDGIGNNADPDDDNDGVLDAQDSAPLDATNRGTIIALPLNGFESAAHGWGWGDQAYRSILAATFTGDGTDRVLHTQGYDVETTAEVSVWLNGQRLGYLARAGAATLGPRDLWWLPAAGQVTGINRVELRQETAGETWGVTQLGLYAAGAAFGNLKTLTGGDTAHADGIQLHLAQSAGGYLLGLSGYDSDTEDEIRITLNGSPLADLPLGGNAAWTPGYQVLLPGAWLAAGDNRLVIKNSGPDTEDWGVRLDGLRPLDGTLGNLVTIPAAQRLDDRISVLIGAATTASVLDYRGYDVDTTSEVRILRNGTPIGYCPVSGNLTWGAPQRLTLPAGQRQVLVFDNTRNPPAVDLWALRLVSWLADTDGDGIPDATDNCPALANPDQADLDGDRQGDACDADIDGDGYANAQDAFPRDRTEWLDTDHDGRGNNADLDDDGDGFPDAVDPDPLDAGKVPPAGIGVFRPSTRQFILDRDGSLSEGAGDITTGPLGLATDRPVTGDWNGDGRDQAGYYRPSTRRFYLDFDGNGTWNTVDRTSLAFGVAGDLPVSGDWNGDGRDEIGVYRPATGQFTLDLDGSLSLTTRDLTTAAFGLVGDLPVIGDWNGDGRDKLGVWRPSTRTFYLDTNGSRTWDSGDRSATFGQAGDLPVAGDWNGDGKDEIGVYRPSERLFYLDADGSNDASAGDALSAPFGLGGDLPVTGRW